MKNVILSTLLLSSNLLPSTGVASESYQLHCRAGLFVADTLVTVNIGMTSSFKVEKQNPPGSSPQVRLLASGIAEQRNDTNDIQIFDFLVPKQGKLIPIGTLIAGALHLQRSKLILGNSHIELAGCSKSAE